MARRLIGLDLGTNAVALAEVTPGAVPRLEAFGQVALPVDAMREGEVVDEVAVAAGIDRLRRELGMRRAPVRVGVASPRVIVRQVELPQMSESELRSALRFQAQDLVPIPIDDAVLDFAVLGTRTDEGGEHVTRVLLAAAHRAAVDRLVRAVEAGGFTVAAIDLVPLALVRALSTPVATDPTEAALGEAIVSFGGGVTVVTVHEAGIPVFVRILGTGGRDLSDVIAADLDLPLETAEALKRRVADPPGAGLDDDLLVRARAAIDRPLGALLEEIRSSIDYYRNQPGARGVGRVLVTGGGSQLPGVIGRLGALVGAPVEPARPRDALAVGDIGFDEADLPRLDPYLLAPVGLALGGSGGGTTVDLRPGARHRAAGSNRVVAGGIAAAVALLLLLGVLTLSRQGAVDDARAAADAQETENTALQAEVAALGSVQAQQAALDQARVEVAGLLANDVSWSRMLQEVARTMPGDVWLSSFQATATPDSGSPDALGTVSFSAVGLDYPAVAAWLSRVGENPSFADLWVPNATRGEVAERDVVNFTSNAAVTGAARSDRAADLVEEGP